jgi:hypothetical protein
VEAFNGDIHRIDGCESLEINPSKLLNHPDWRAAIGLGQPACAVHDLFRRKVGVSEGIKVHRDRLRYDAAAAGILPAI